MHRIACVAAIACLAACSRQEAGAEAATPAAPEASGAPAAAGPLPAPPRRRSAGKTLRFDPAVIVDANGFGQPIGAYTLFIPHGWHTQGGVEWANQYLCTNGYAVNWRASAPEGGASIVILPQTGWNMNNYGAGSHTPGCAQAAFTNVRQYLEALIARWLPAARLLDYRAREDIRASLGVADTVTPMPAGQIRAWIEAGEILFALDDHGRELRGALAAAVMFNHSRSDYGTGPMEALNATALPAWGVMAPEDEFNPAWFEAMRRSIKANPRWEQLIAGHNARIGQVALEEARKRSEIITRSNAEISRIRQDAWNSYQESSDRRAREFGEAIRGVETYRDPDAAGGTVELSHLYDNAWRLADGSYVLTNDADFEPWRDLQVEGRRLEAVQ
ncbi:MAG: hypothetical protein IT480_01615 [Gammaproteobacteria bacterium]|nr:hypothetical protein [Gammaproteobacteria bacterium]